MVDESTQSVRDAIALTTLMVDGTESGAGWGEALTFARQLLAERGDNVLMAQTHLLVQALSTLRDVLNELPDDVATVGVERPVTVLALLREFGADAADEV